MNWLRSIKRLLGRFWADLFSDSDFLLGVEYLLSFYSKLTQNQYLNWRNGMIAANMDVEQSALPYVILLEIPENDPAQIEREWYGWVKLWDRGSANKFAKHEYYSEADIQDMGWIMYSNGSIDCPDYMIDHMYSYKKILIKGLDYDFSDGRFLFYTNPAELDMPLMKLTDESGALHIYYKMFGATFKTQKVCDPVTGFESEWLNPCSDIAWDIHQNGATYYNTKQLLGKATDSVVCESDGIAIYRNDEQDYHCIEVNGKLYISKYEPNVVDGAEVTAGTVLFGSLQMYKGTETVTAVQVPGIKVMTDAGQLAALNNTSIPYTVNGMFVLPLVGDPVAVHDYKEICNTNMQNTMCPYIQVGTYNMSTGSIEVNPYEFITKKLRRGRAVTIRLASTCLDYLAAALRCLRKSSCASGIVNVYVATETEPPNIFSLTTIAASAPEPTSREQHYFNTTTNIIYTAYPVTITQIGAMGDELPEPATVGQTFFSSDANRIFTAIRNDEQELVWDDGVIPDEHVVYKNALNNRLYRWVFVTMIDITQTAGTTNGNLIWVGMGEPDSNTLYKNLEDNKAYRWVNGAMLDVTGDAAAQEATLNLSVFSADAGMMAVSAVETLTIQDECAKARIIL